MPTSPPRINITQFAWLVRSFAWPAAPKLASVEPCSLEGVPSSEADLGDMHLVVLPDGSICVGRSWRIAAGDADLGFVIGIAGNAEQQRATGLQQRCIEQVISVLQEQFRTLEPSGIRVLAKDGTGGIDLTDASLRRRVKAMRASAENERLKRAVAEFEVDSTQGLAATALLHRLTHSLQDTAMNSPTDTLLETDPILAAARDLDLKKLTLEQIATLKRHVVNLRHGKLNSGGPFSTSEKDVDAIFDVHLAAALTKAKKDKRKLKILLWAHGGLVPESAALDHVLNHCQQWLGVDIYPIYFVWETDFWTSLKSKLGWDKEERGFWGNLFAAPTDWALEKAAYLPGNAIWGQMKQYAADGVKADGGARYTARKLAAFIKADSEERAELYAIGHSAGSNFMSWFLPEALAAGAGGFKELFLLAPAITTMEFNQRLAGLIGNSIGRSTIFTMKEAAELDDNCFQVYRKSLLYFISRAFEPNVPTPLLGLEESLRASKPLRKLYGLGEPSKIGEVVFSPNNESDGSSASNSTTHGGFDNDHLTLNSMACRILGRKVAPFEKEVQRGSMPTIAAPTVTRGDARAPVRRALCIGIDAYASKPLSGCVNDARLWKQELESLGFDAGLLTDGQATRAGILHGMRQLLKGSAEGDVLALQYSGHGTRVPDVNGDESDGTDEALVPFDYEDGNLIIDDDLGMILDSIPNGVNFTLFMDCCHSGTNTRVFGFSPMAARAGEKERYLVMPKEALQRYIDVRQNDPHALPQNPYAKKLEILFAACRPDQTAKEIDGHGYFTRTAVPLLRLSKEGIDHTTFVNKVVAGFPLPPDSQLPQLDCDDPRKLGLLFGSATPRTEAAGETFKAPAGAEAAMLMETMRDYIKLLNRLL